MYIFKGPGYFKGTSKNIFPGQEITVKDLGGSRSSDRFERMIANGTITQSKHAEPVKDETVPPRKPAAKPAAKKDDIGKAGPSK